MALEFDKTREAIKLKDMSDAEREAMLKKFQQGGGKVLNERDEQKEAQQRKRNIDRRYIGLSNSDIASQSETLSSAQKESPAPEEEVKNVSPPRRNLSDLILLYLKCYFISLTNITGTKVRRKFLLSIPGEFQKCLEKFHNHLNECILGRGENVLELLDALDDKSPVLIEILNHLYELYNMFDFNTITNVMEENRSKYIELSLTAREIRNIYRKLYYLRNYQKMSVKTVNEFFALYARSKEKTRISINSMKKEMLAGLRTIFHYMHNFYFLLCCSERAIFKENSDIFRELIDFDPNEAIGQRSKQDPHKLRELAKEEYSIEASEETDIEIEDWEEQPANDEAKSTHVEATETENAPPPQEEHPDAVTQTKEYQYGMSLMEGLTPDQLRKKFYPGEKVDMLGDFDKVFLAHGYYQEFDREYSFVLTTRQIHFEVDYSHGVKKDYSKIMADLYTGSREREKAFEEYCSLVGEFKFSQARPISNYVEQSKRESLLKSRIDSQGRITRNLISDFLGQVASNLALLITDMKDRKEKGIISNMNQPIYFQGGSIEVQKKLNGKTVSECITGAYCYALALKHRIDKGDLFGGVIQMNEDEIKKTFGENYYNSWHPHSAL